MADAPLPRRAAVFRRAFRPEASRLDVEAQGLEGAVHALVAALAAEGLVPWDEIVAIEEAVLAHERDASTAIGFGASVPHTRLPWLEAPIVALARLREPLNLGATDGRPTRFVFLLLSGAADPDAHLELLVAIARLVGDDRFRHEAGEAPDPAGLVAAVEGALDRGAEPRAPARPSGREGLEPALPLGRALRDDVARRLRHYRSDFLDGLRRQTLAATIFLFFAAVAPAVAFGGLMAALTGGEIGVIEMLVATAVGGVLYALFSGQPLTILGGTGPILVFTAVLYDACARLGLPFLPTYAWVGLWTAAITLGLAVGGASAWIRFCTRFTDEIFALFMSAIFVWEASRKLYDAFAADDTDPHTGLVSLVLALGTLWIATQLREMRSSVYLRTSMRTFLADFGSVIAIGAMVAVAHAFHQADLPALVVPDTLRTTTGRPWLVDLGAVPPWVPVAAVVPAALCTVLVYLDQNITSRLVNRPDHRLMKGPAYHLDLAVVGVLLAGSSLLGLPWLVAATVRSLYHVKALADVETAVTPDGRVEEHVVHVVETRLTGVAIHVLIGSSVLLVPLLDRYDVLIPMAVLYGLFLYMGITSVAGNQLWERLKLWAMDPARYPPSHYVRRVPPAKLHLWTGAQLAGLVLLWVVQASAFALLFPLVIALLIPLRFWLSRRYGPEELAALDSEEEPEEELQREAGM